MKALFITTICILAAWKMADLLKAAKRRWHAHRRMRDGINPTRPQARLLR